MKLKEILLENETGFTAYLKNKYSKEIDRIHIFKIKWDNIIKINDIILNKEYNNKFTFKKIMSDIINLADKKQFTIILDPDFNIGISQKKLIIFLKDQFNFVENKGKNKRFDISEKMFREPFNIKYEFKNDHLDYYSGQHNFRASAYYKNKFVGKVDYTIFKNKIYINYLEVDEKYRRQGIGTQLLDFIQKENNIYDIDHGNLTDDGSEFNKSYTMEI